MKRNREHGRIISVETLQRGSALDTDAAAGAASITVEDAGDFDEDGGWLYIGAQVVEFTACDDDTGVITLADPLAAAGEQGDLVAVYDPLYEEVVDYQLALVELDGEYDNPDPVTAEVAEGVSDLPEGDRGKAGESCVLHRVGEDEWEVVGVSGRPRKSQGIRFEQDDAYTLTSADVTAGSAALSLSHRPIDEALTCYLAGVPQRPTNWTVDYDARTLTIPLGGWEQAGDVAWVHYAYRKGVTTAVVTAPPLPALYHWKLDETGGTSWADSGPGAANLSISGSPTLGQAPAGSLPGHSASFDGDGAGATLGEEIPIPLGDLSELSWGFFVKSSSATAQGIITRDASNHTPSQGDRHWGFEITTSGRLTLILFNEAGSFLQVEGGPVITDGAWHRCWITLGGGNVTMYVDGAQVDQWAWASPTRTGELHPIILGASSLYTVPSYHYLIGALDDVWILDGMMTAAEVAAEWAAVS